MYKLSCFAAIMCLLSCFAFGAGENILKSADFTSTYGWSGASTSTNEYHSAPRSLFFESLHFWRAGSQRFDVNDGDIFTASCWVKCLGSGGGVEIRWFSEKDKQIGSSRILSSPFPEEWEYRENERIVPPDGSTYGLFYIYMPQNVSGAKIWVDDVYLSYWVDKCTVVHIR